jgi:uncharacterized protein (TIGR02453 family)
MTTFTGWPQEAIAWFQGLEADNSKAYFEAHRPTYASSVREPLEALLAAVDTEYGEGKVFRPNRDVRFSADKSPYKTNAAALIGSDGRAAYYVEVSADGLAAGGGYRHLTRDQLARFRAAVDAADAGPELERRLAAAAAAGLETFGEGLRTAPRGYPVDHPRIELLRLKDVILVRRDAAGGVMHSARALDWVRETWHALQPVLDWLDRHVGAPDDPGR